MTRAPLLFCIVNVVHSFPSIVEEQGAAMGILVIPNVHGGEKVFKSGQPFLPSGTSIRLVCLIVERRERGECTIHDERKNFVCKW